VTSSKVKERRRKTLLKADAPIIGGSGFVTSLTNMEQNYVGTPNVVLLPTSIGNVGGKSPVPAQYSSLDSSSESELWLNIYIPF
jgi:hypothetical protein